VPKTTLLARVTPTTSAVILLGTRVSTVNRCTDQIFRIELPETRHICVSQRNYSRLKYHRLSKSFYSVGYGPLRRDEPLRQTKGLNQSKSAWHGTTRRARHGTEWESSFIAAVPPQQLLVPGTDIDIHAHSSFVLKTTRVRIFAGTGWPADITASTCLDKAWTSKKTVSNFPEGLLTSMRSRDSCPSIFCPNGVCPMTFCLN